MSFRLPFVNRLWSLVMPLALGLLLLASGCGRDHCNNCSACTSCASDTTVYQPSAPVSYESAPVQPSYAQPSYQPSAPPTNYQPVVAEGMRGPRSQAEIDALFSSAQLQSLPPMPPRAIAPPPCPQPLNCLPDAALSALGESSWNVPLSREWHHIVIHHSASSTGSAASFDSAHKARGWDGLGYHFVIGNGSGSGDGQVETGYRWTRQLAGAHAGNFEYNQHGVGICLVGDFEHGGPPSPRQMASLRRLVLFLQAKANIQTASIVGHGNVPGRNTECPGRNFNMSAFRAELNACIRQAAAAAPMTTRDNAVAVSAVASPMKIGEKTAVVKAVAAP